MVAELSYADGDKTARIGIVNRVLSGEVFVARKELQNFGLMGMMVEASLAGIAKSMGTDIAERVRQVGFERIHEIVAAPEILKITDAVYDEVLSLAPRFLERYVPNAFPGAGPLYFERYPNVRFHIPYDLAHDHRRTFQGFRGEGKVAAHAPHRDSWLDCPENGVNVWIAIGPVRHGNGLTIFKDDNDRKLSYMPSGDIADREKLHKPVTFALEPGDAIIFHTNQLHGSELNRTNDTRFVISFRLTFGRPHFPNDHRDEYVHAGWNSGLTAPLAMLPAKLQASYARAVFKRVKRRVGSLLKHPATNSEEGDSITARPLVAAHQNSFILSLAELPVGTIAAVTNSVCVARLSDSKCVAISRRCPHRGGDFSNGWIDNGKIVCPWHNLCFDPTTGASPCAALPPLKRYACEMIRNNRIKLDIKRCLT